MKSVKIVILLTFVSLLSTWSDVQAKNEDVLKKNISCTYFTTKEKAEDDTFGIKEFTLSSDKNSLYFSYNNKKKEMMKENNYIKIGQYNFFVNKNFIEDYLEKYKENNACPENIYINQSDTLSFRVKDCKAENLPCTKYSRGKTTVTNNEGKKIDCHHSAATSCLKFNYKDQYGNDHYFEIGVYKAGNSTKKYLGVATDANYKSMILDDDESNGLGVESIGKTYMVPDDEAMNELWLGNNKYISVNDIVIKISQDTHSLYYITGPNSSQKYVNSTSGTAEQAPNLDSDPEKNKNYTSEEAKKSCKQIDGKYYDVDGKKVSKKEFEKSCNLDCGIFSGEFEKFLKSALALIRFAVPLIIIGLGIVDFIKATAAQDDSLLKKAANMLVKRMVIGVIIFVLPTLLEFILAIADIPYGTCGIK